MGGSTRTPRTLAWALVLWGSGCRAAAEPDVATQQQLQDGHALRKEGRHQESVQAYAAAVQSDPTNARAHLALGNGLSSLGLHDQAVRSFAHAARLEPDDPHPHINLCNALRLTRQVDSAIEAGRTATRLAPGNPLAHLNLGNALQARGSLDEAVTAYDEVLRLDPRNHLAHANVGAVLMARGRLQSAVAAFQRAVDLRPDFAVGHINLGNALKGLGEYEAAERSYTRALELDGASPTALNNLGTLAAARGRQRLASSLYDKALEINPNYEAAQRNRDKLTTSRAFAQATAAERRFLRERAAAVESLGDAAQSDVAKLAMVIETLREVEMSETAMWDDRAAEMPAVIHASSTGDKSSITLADFAWGGVWAQSLFEVFAAHPVRAAVREAQKMSFTALVLGSNIGFEAFFIALTFGVPTVGVELLEGLVALARRCRAAFGVQHVSFVQANALDVAIPASVRLVYVDDAAWDAHNVAEVAAKLADELRPGAIVIHTDHPAYKTVAGLEAVEVITVPTSWTETHRIAVSRVVRRGGRAAR